MQIFLSYASERRPVADTLALALRERGHSVFFDRDDLNPGEGYSSRIEQSIKDSDLMIFLISPESVQPGRFTVTELAIARKYWRSADRKLLPVMLAPTDLALVPSFAKSVDILTPQGNLPAEVAAAVDDLRGVEYALKVGAVSSAIALAFGLLSYFSFEADGYGVRHIPLLPFTRPIPAPEVGLIFSIPIGIALWMWGLRRWWAFLMPVLIVTLCYCIIAPSISDLTYVVAKNPEPTKAAFQQIAERYRFNGEDFEKLNNIRQQYDHLSITLERIRLGLFCGLVMALGSLLSLALVMSQFRSIFRWLFVLAVGSVIAGIDAFIVLLPGLTTDPGSMQFHRWQAMGLIIVWQVVFGALLGYWLARGQTKISG